MSVIEKKLLFKGSKGEIEKNVLFDSGATYSVIRKELAKTIANLEPLPEVMEFGTTDEGTSLKTTESMRCNFYINGDRFSDEFMVIEKLSEELIIGAKTMQAWRMKLDLENDDVIYDPKVTKLRIV